MSMMSEQIKIHTGIDLLRLTQQEHNLFFLILSSTTKAQLIKSTRSKK